MKLKQDRLLGIFYRLIKGEEISITEIAKDFNVSTKTISRDIQDIRSFLADSRELLGYKELIYANKKYKFSNIEFLSPQEIFCILKIILNSKAIKTNEIKDIFDKFSNYVCPADRKLLTLITNNELTNYQPVKQDSKDLFETLWDIINAISNKQSIKIDYFKIDRTRVTRHLKPISITFSEFYFYLIAFDKNENIKFYRIDRINSVKIRDIHTDLLQIDISNIKKRTPFMYSGELMTIKFEYTGISVQSILDKLETATVLSKDDDKYVIECQAYGNGIKMYLLSQGAKIKVLSPEYFVEEIKQELENMRELYL